MSKSLILLHHIISFHPDFGCIVFQEFFKKELSREERRSEMEKLNEKITSLLTDEQKEAFEQMKKERPQRKRS